MFLWLMKVLGTALRFVFLWSPLAMIASVLAFATLFRSMLQYVFDTQLFSLFSPASAYLQIFQSWLVSICENHDADIFSTLAYAFALDKFGENIVLFLKYLDVALFGYVYLIGGIFLYGAASVITAICTKASDTGSSAIPH